MGGWSLHMDCIKLKQGRQGTGLPAFVNKCYWNPATPISFCIDCGCFCATRAEPNRHDRDYLALKA